MLISIAVLSTLVVQPGCRGEPVPTPGDRLLAAGPLANELLMAARHRANAGQYAVALGIVDSLLRVAPSLPEAHYQRGEILMQLYQLAEAAAAYDQTVTLDPYHRGGWYKRGHVAFEQGRYREAIGFYERQREAILASPRELRDYYQQADAAALPQTWLQVGRAYQLLHEADSAQWAYEEVLALDSTHAQASAWLANLADEEGHIEEALVHMRRAWKYGKGNLEYAYELGTLLLEQGRFEEARPFLERVTAAQPWNAGAHYNLGRTLIALGQAEEGQRLMAVTDQLQDLDQEIAYAQAAAARYPDEPARWRVLAELFGRAGRRAEQQHARQVASALAQNAGVPPRRDAQ